MPAKNRKPHNATIIDVAREANVSYSTVSRVLNNVAHVKPDKRERVLEAIERLGYVANLQARSLVGGRTLLIGMIVQDLAYSYTDQIVRGIDDELAAMNYNLMLFTTHRQRAKETHYVRSLTQGLVDGLLLLLPLASTIYLKGLFEEQFPYVVIDHHGFDDFSLTVTATNWQGAFDSTTYLLNLGHQSIGFIAGDPEISSAGERLAGYRAALEAWGVPFNPELVEMGYFNYAGGLQATQTLLNRPDPPTALFAGNDWSAQGAIEVIRSRGWSIPDDISILGFDDVPEAAHLRPPLTTVRQPLVEMGRMATRMLIQRIEQPDAVVSSAVMKTELILRESCGSPKSVSSTKSLTARESERRYQSR